MFDRNHVYGWDIETANDDGQGLTARDPNSRLTSISFTHSVGVEVISHDDEAQILTDWLDLLMAFEPGLLGSWNGSFFDIPFIADRAQILDHRLVAFWHLYPMPGLRPKYDYLPGHTTGYALTFPTPNGLPHQHLDIAQSYRAFAAEANVAWSLKPVGEALGHTPKRLDAANLHTYSQAERDEYSASDAILTRDLTLAKLGL